MARHLSFRARLEVLAGEREGGTVGRWCRLWQVSAGRLDRYEATAEPSGVLAPKR
jgi:hypothetical protein